MNNIQEQFLTLTNSPITKLDEQIKKCSNLGPGMDQLVLGALQDRLKISKSKYIVLLIYFIAIPVLGGFTGTMSLIISLIILISGTFNVFDKKKRFNLLKYLIHNKERFPNHKSLLVKFQPRIKKNHFRDLIAEYMNT